MENIGQIELMKYKLKIIYFLKNLQFSARDFASVVLCNIAKIFSVYNGSPKVCNEII